MSNMCEHTNLCRQAEVQQSLNVWHAYIKSLESLRCAQDTLETPSMISIKLWKYVPSYVCKKRRTINMPRCQTSANPIGRVSEVPIFTAEERKTLNFLYADSRIQLDSFSSSKNRNHWINTRWAQNDLSKKYCAWLWSCRIYARLICRSWGYRVTPAFKTTFRFWHHDRFCGTVAWLYSEEWSHPFFISLSKYKESCNDFLHSMNAQALKLCICRGVSWGHWVAGEGTWSRAAESRTSDNCEPNDGRLKPQTGPIRPCHLGDTQCGQMPQEYQFQTWHSLSHDQAIQC